MQVISDIQKNRLFVVENMLKLFYRSLSEQDNYIKHLKVIIYKFIMASFSNFVKHSS